MKEGSRANALLVELLLVIFFFMIAAAILVQVFADARMKSRTAYATNAAMLEAENIADDLYASENPERVLESYGFTAGSDGWTLSREGYLLKVTAREEKTESGILKQYEVSGIEGDKTLLTLPSARFIPEEVNP